MRKLLLTLAAVLLLATSATAVNLYVDTAKIDTDVPPVVVEGRTLVPVRAIFEALGAEVIWDPSDQSVFAYRESDGRAVLLYLDDTVMAYRLDSDSEPVAIELDVPPMAINNRTLVPIRAVAESFDCDVEWDQTNQQVIITAE